MARTVTQNADLRFRGRDDGASKTIKKVKTEITRLPGGFAKSASALNMFSAASDKMGGSVANATAKISDIASLVATGGIAGIAIAAMTAAVAAGTYIYGKYKEEAARVEAAAKKLTDQNKKLAGSFASVKKQTQSALEKLGNYGRAEVEIVTERLEREQMVAKLQASHAQAVVNYHEGLRTYQDRELGRYDELHTAALDELRIHSDTVFELHRQIGAEEALAGKIANKTKAKKKDTETAKDRKQIEKDYVAFVESELAREQAIRDEAANALLEKYQSRLASRRAFLAADAAWRKAKEKEVSDAKGKFLDEETKRFEKEMAGRKRAQQALVSGMISTWGSGISQMITLSREHAAEREQGREVELSASQLAAREEINRAREVSNARLNLILNSVQAAVNAYAIQAGALAGASFAWAPPLIPVAAAAAIAIIKALLTQMPSYQLGGVVPGIDTGRDSVIAAMRPNERVFSPEHNERMVRAVEGGSGAGSPTIIFQSLAPPTSAEAARAARTTLRMIDRARTRGF